MKQIFTLKAIVLGLCLGLVSIVTAQEINAVYMVGDMGPAGWSIGNPTPMFKDVVNPKIFNWKGALKAGELKFSTFKGDWCDGQWIKAANADQSITVGDYIITNGCDGADNKWRLQPGEVGNYSVTVNLETAKVSFEPLPAGYTNLYLLGDAAPAGYNLADPTPMVQSGTNSNVFTWEGELKAGELKISTFKGSDWCGGQWINAATSNQSVSAGGFIITNGCNGPDNKWKLSAEEAGKYTITIDVLNQTISFVKATGAIYNTLYLVGNATPSGWNISTPVAFTQDASNVNLFTWEGPLVAGYVKFSTFTGGWCDGDWLLAATADQALSGTAYTIYNGCPPGEADLKWIVAAETAGYYRIVIDLVNKTVTFSPTTGLNNVNKSSQLSVYPNPAQNTITVSQRDVIQRIEIVTLSGKNVLTSLSNKNSSTIDVSELARGIYLVKATSQNNSSAIHKLVITR